jgi:hypothetical protein
VGDRGLKQKGWASYDDILCCWVLLLFWLRKAARSYVEKLVMSKRIGLDSDEEGIGFVLEGGDRTVIIGKGGLKMGERLVVRSLGGIRWRRTACPECGADLALVLVEAFPDAKPASIAEVAADSVDGGDDGAGGGVLEEGPERVGGEAEASDLVGEPDAEGASAAGAEITIAAEDTVCAAGLALWTGIVVAVEIAVLDEVAGFVAVGAQRQLELLGEGYPLLVVAVEASRHGDGRGMSFGESWIIPTQNSAG